VFVKLIEREEARRLRQEDGASIKAIARALSVSPSSVSRWVADIALSDKQVAALRRSNARLDGQRAGSARSSVRARTRRVVAQIHGRLFAARGSELHQLGCMLYWAEGSKYRNRAVFTNSDPDMLRLFLRFLSECYDVTADQITLTVNVHLGNGLTLSAIEAWWLDRLGLPLSCVRQATVNNVSRASQHKRRTLPYGTVRLAVCSTFIVQSIYGAIQAYAGVDRPEWLD
jgi:transposase-like protein